MPTPTVNTEPSELINDDLRKLSYDVSQAERDGFIDVKVELDDISMHISFALKDASKAVLITEIQDPKGTTIYTADVDLNTGEPNSIVSGFADTVLGDLGDFAVFLPPNPHLKLQEGNYRLSFIREDNSPIKSISTLIKSIPTGKLVDEETYQADLNIWIAHPEPEFNNDAFK